MRGLWEGLGRVEGMQCSMGRPADMSEVNIRPWPQPHVALVTSDEKLAVVSRAARFRP